MSKPSFFGPRLKMLDSVLHGCYYHAVFSIKHKNGRWMFKVQVPLPSAEARLRVWLTVWLVDRGCDGWQQNNQLPWRRVLSLPSVPPPQTCVDSLGRAKRDTSPAVPPSTLPVWGRLFCRSCSRRRSHIPPWRVGRRWLYPSLLRHSSGVLEMC